MVNGSRFMVKKVLKAIWKFSSYLFVPQEFSQKSLKAQEL